MSERWSGLGFWWRWVVANSLGELMGLGGVAAIGFTVNRWFGEPQGLYASVIGATLLVALGCCEGAVVGYCQQRVLRTWFQAGGPWIKATAVGAGVAWALGMLPSVVMHSSGTHGAPPPGAPGPVAQWLLGAALGLVTGPVLAAFQWRVLRHHLAGAAWWLPANAAAWALGMPVLFMGAGALTPDQAMWQLLLAVAGTLAAAGAVVGAVHGLVLLWLRALGSKRSQHRTPRDAAATFG